MRQETLRRRVELARASRTSVEMSGGFDADLGGGKWGISPHGIMGIYRGDIANVYYD